LFAAGTPVITNNIIVHNSNSGGQGGGISMVNDSDALVVQNLFYGNTASQGTGLYISVPSGSTGPTLVNNTVVGGTGSSQGSAIYATGFDNLATFYNNLLIGAPGENAVFCDTTFSSLPPTFTNNDAFGFSGGTGLEGSCASQGTMNGNISANPLFASVAKSNYQLTAVSPAINAGDNLAPHIPKKDLAGKKRIVGSAIDLGVFEFQAGDVAARE
jgi:hypothetical protein